MGDIAARGESGTGERITGAVSSDGVLWQVVIHMVFIASAVALAWIDRMSGAAHHTPAHPARALHEAVQSGLDRLPANLAGRH